MKIEHLAIWVEDLEGMRDFYERYFGASSNEIYHNPQKGFYSYFLSFEKSTARLELMKRTDIGVSSNLEMLGLAHFAISLGSKEKVDSLTNAIRENGFTIKGEPRTTGDGYYESVICDPEGNLIELTV